MKLHAGCTLTILLALGAAPGHAMDHGPLAGKADYRANHTARIDAGDMLTLVKDGKAVCEIVVSPDEPVAQFAAEELQGLIERATGAKPPVVRKRTDGTPSIVLGSGQAEAWGVDTRLLPRDAFVIRRRADAVLIAGRDDPLSDIAKRMNTGIGLPMAQEWATLFGVYDFAERFLGARFYFPGEIGTVVPRRADWSVPAMDIYEEPDFFQRRVSYSNGWYEKLPAKEYTNQVNLMRLRLRGSTFYIPNCHGLARFGYLERFGKTNPEYFALIRGGKRNNDTSMAMSGHLCFSNPDVVAEIAQDAEAFLTGKPASSRGVTTRRGHSVWDSNVAVPGYFNVMPQDGLGETRWCRCPKCGPYWDNGTQGELIWGYTAEVARRMQSKGVPGYITNMAYGMVRHVPKVDLPENVLVMVATAGPWNEKFPASQKGSDQLIHDWNAKLKTRKVWLWNYAIQGLGRYPGGMPTLAPRLWASYFKRLAPEIIGAFVECENDNVLFNYLNWHVFHKLAWDSSLDPEALLAEHHSALFGPAAAPMGKFFDRCERLFVDGCLPEQKDTPLGPVSASRTPSEIWEVVFDDAAMKEFDALFAEAERLAMDDADSLKRVKWFQEKFLGEIVRGRAAHIGQKREIENLVLDVPRLPEGLAVTLDGALDEAAWKAAATVSLVPNRSNEKTAMATTVRLLWTPDTVYVGYECEEPLVAGLTLDSKGRDDKGTWMDSGIELFLDTEADRQAYYQIMVSANGSVCDAAYKVLGRTERRTDFAWNCGIEAKVRIGQAGYTMEIALPTKDFGGALPSGATWVANFCRNRCVRGLSARENQHQTWSPFLRGNFHDIEKFGRIRFVK